jgi:hypothetical protein
VVRRARRASDGERSGGGQNCRLFLFLSVASFLVGCFFSWTGAVAAPDGRSGSSSRRASCLCPMLFAFCPMLSPVASSPRSRALSSSASSVLLGFLLVQSLWLNQHLLFPTKTQEVLDFLGTWVAGGLGLGGLGLCGLDLSFGLGPSPPSVHIALCLLCFLVSFSSSRQSTSFVSNRKAAKMCECFPVISSAKDCTLLTHARNRTRPHHHPHLRQQIHRLPFSSVAAGFLGVCV